MLHAVPVQKKSGTKSNQLVRALLRTRYMGMVGMGGGRESNVREPYLRLTYMEPLYLI